MKVLLLHNRYQVPGGEEAVVYGECALLRAEPGVTVDLLEVSNDDIASAAQKIKTAIQVPYSFPSRRLVSARIQSFRPDIVHVHNFFPTLTPSVYDACRSAGVAVVQTLHNYRLVCANGLLFRDGGVCTECLGRTWGLPAVQHGCYRGSRLGSAAAAMMVGVHRVRGTWAERVDRFIALTEFARKLFAERAGIPAEKIAVKPNAATDAGEGDGAGGYALYVGRLSPEKGIETLLAANGNGELGMPLVVAGNGPLLPKVEAAHGEGKLTYAGLQDAEGVRRLMRRARLLIISSLWYEGLPMVVPEAFSAGLPIAASRLGALETLIDEGRNGLLFAPGDAAALRNAVRRFAGNGDKERSMRQRARETYEALYRPDANLKRLLEIYEQARAGRSAFA